MLLLVLALFADASAALPTPDITRVTVAVNAAAALESTTYKSAASTSSGGFGNGTANVTVYPWKPLVDDESPRSLQPFLQRTSCVAIAGGGQHLRATYSSAAGGGTYTQDYVPGSASARWFALPAFAVLGAVGAAYQHDERAPVASLVMTRKLWKTWGSVGVDVRSADASLTLQWQALGVDETAIGRPNTAPGFFGARFTLAGRIVIDGRYDLTAGAELIPDGAIGRAGLGWYPTKDLGLSFGAQIEHGQIYWDTTTDYDAVTGGPALSYWLGRRVELRVSYAPSWVSRARATEWEHELTMGITGRLPNQ